MKKVKFYQADGLYMARCCASANSLFFENQNDHLAFFSLLDKYLGGFIEVVHYAIIPTAWIIIFRTRSEEAIRSSYLEQRSRSKKAIPDCTHSEIGRILSEHFRIFHAQLVKITNTRNGRHGSKVHSRFEKFVFDSEISMQEEIIKMEALLEFNSQWMARYHAELGYYDCEGEIKKDAELVSAKRCYSKECVGSKWLESFRGLLKSIDVVRRLISQTYLNHFGQNPPDPGLRLST